MKVQQMSTYNPKEFPIIETDRLMLRAVYFTDCHRLFEIFKNEEVMRYYGMFAITGLEGAISLIEALQSTFHENRGIRWAVVLKETGILIGTCGFHNFNEFHRRSELGYELDQEYWHQGYGTEMLQAMIQYGAEQMNLHRIEALVYPENIPSQVLLERNGFEREGLLKAYAYFREVYTDLILFSWINPNHQRTET